MNLIKNLIYKYFIANLKKAPHWTAPRKLDTFSLSWRVLLLMAKYFQKYICNSKDMHWNSLKLQQIEKPKIKTNFNHLSNISKKFQNVGSFAFGTAMTFMHSRSMRHSSLLKALYLSWLSRTAHTHRTKCRHQQFTFSVCPTLGVG